MVQNADITVVISLKDILSAAIDPSTISTYQFFVYYMDGNTKKLVATYKKSNTGLYGITYDNVGDTYTIILNRELTSTLPVGKVYLESLITLTATSPYIGSVKNISSTGNYLFTNEKSSAI